MTRPRLPHSRVADEARSLIARLRALAGLPDVTGHDPVADGPTDAGEGIPRRAESTWEPGADLPEPLTLTTRLVDEDGGESELPLEFATATMGHILLGQSQTEAARQMFLSVYARNPNDAEARRGLELTGALPPQRPSPKKSYRPSRNATTRMALSAASGEEPSEMLDRTAPPERYNVSEARSLPVDPVSLVVFWELTEEARAQAAMALGEGASVVLNVVSLTVTAGGVARAERWIEGIPAVGDWFVGELPPGATHLCSVGLRVGDNYLPIANAEPVVSPRGTAAPTLARVRATLVLPAVDGHPHSRILSLTGPADALAVATAQLLSPAARLIIDGHPSGTAELFERLVGPSGDHAPSSGNTSSW